MSQPFLHDSAERIDYFLEPARPERTRPGDEAAQRARAERLERQVSVLQAELDRRAAAQTALEERVAVLEWMAQGGSRAS